MRLQRIVGIRKGRNFVRHLSLLLRRAIVS